MRVGIITLRHLFSDTEYTINRDCRMYVSWTDILSAAAAVLTGFIGLFLLLLKAVKWYRKKKKVQ